MKIETVLVRAVAMAMIACTAVHVGTARANPTSVTMDVSGISDMDERGAVSNVIRELFVGAGAAIESLKWDINLTSHDPSYLSEMQLTFSDTSGNGVTFTPGGGDDFEGTASYAGFQDLRLIAESFQLAADGVLRLEFHDAYKDLPFDEPEGVWNFGTLTFGVSTVPEPQTVALVLGALVSMCAARRRMSKSSRTQCGT